MEIWEQVKELSQLKEKQIDVLRIFNAVSSFSLTYLEIQRYFQKEPRHNDRAYVINCHKYKSIGTHWIAW